MQKTSLKDLIKVSLYTGATAYGGPAMFTQIKKKFVTEKKWIDEKEFLDVLSFVQILPGATGILTMACIGYKLRDVLVALLINAVVTLGKTIFPKYSLRYYKGFLIAALIFMFSFWFRINFVYLIIDAGILGFLSYYLSLIHI